MSCTSCGHYQCASCPAQKDGWDCCSCGYGPQFGFPLEMDPPNPLGGDASNPLPPRLHQALYWKDSPHLESHLEVLIREVCESRLESKHEWLQELLDIGLSPGEVAQLLLEEKSDSPWIHFEPPEQVILSRVDPVWHLLGCPHTRLLQPEMAAFPSVEDALPPRIQKREVKRLVEGYCGLGGVVPSTRPKIGLVEFDLPRQRAHLTYCGSSSLNIDQALTVQQNIMANHLLKLAESLDNLHCAASTIQKHRLCCTSFTILIRPLYASHAELIQIPLSYITEFHRTLLGDRSLGRNANNIATSCRNCRVAHYSCDGQNPCMRCIVLEETCDDQEVRHGPKIGDRDDGRHSFGRRPRKDVLGTQESPIGQSLGERLSQSVRMVSPFARTVLFRLGLHPKSPSSNLSGVEALHWELSIACLATQVLATGLLSYVQGHVSPLEPSFLDTNIQQVSLLGAQPLGSPSQVTLRPVRLTCMDEMLQKPVLVFQSQRTDFDTAPALNLLATPENILDTWGPGCYITAPSKIGGGPTQDIRGVRVAGGTISESADRSDLFHFYPATNIRLVSSRTIHQDERIFIGASINSGCDSTMQMYHSQMAHNLNKLGTFSGGWEVSQRQAGFQGGQYANISFTQTWSKLPDSTVKKFQLSKRNPFDLVFLEAPWGLQISYCTGISKRVRMRDLLADVIPAYLSIQLKIPNAWKDLERDNVIEIFHGSTNLQEWYNERSTEEQEFLEETMRDVLELLKFTGIERTGRLLSVAWILPKQDFHCLRIPCEHESSWTKILADSEECATFAYFTPKCLVTESITCGTLQSKWQNKSYALSTAFLYVHHPTEKWSFSRKAALSTSRTPSTVLKSLLTKPVKT
ncbi:hypothetical protein HDK64DRAFT_12242 [Phyllosticta capitalensis]